MAPALTGARSGSGIGAAYSQTQEYARAFLQRRVASFGLVLSLVYGVFLVWRFLVFLFGDAPASHDFFLPFQAATVASFVSLWLLCRGRARSIRFVRTVETIFLLLGCVGGILAGFYIPYPVRPDYIILMSLSYTLVVRSIYVPSTARHTLLIGALLGVELIASIYLIHRWGHDPSIYTAGAHPIVLESAELVAWRNVFASTLWWGVAVGIATATSRVVHGLRQEVRDARRLGQYTLLERLGEGGMGVVYRASHAMLRRPAAVKLLPPDKFGPENLARFEREVQRTAQLTHPNTVRVFDYGRTPDGVLYYAMEYLDGASLNEVVAVGGPLPPGRVIQIMDQTAGALAEAHAIGLIHRDIKPANILLTQQGGAQDVAKVVDFGLVKEVGSGAGHEATSPALTQADSTAGTPQYMAPEAITSPDQVDPRTDLYALGAVGYFLLTGQDVFSARTVAEMHSHHLRTAPVPPSERLERSVPADLEAVLLRCLEKDPARRPAAAHELQSALRACRDVRSWSEADARRWWERHGHALRATRHQEIARATITVDLKLREPATVPDLPGAHPTR